MELYFQLTVRTKKMIFTDNPKHNVIKCFRTQILARYEYHLDDFLGFIHPACILILLKSYL
jgi:hypothetical protein